MAWTPQAAETRAPRRDAAPAAPFANAPGATTINVLQGQFHVTNDDGVMLATILGSCVAACIRDPVARVGGLNHFLLPDGESEPGGSSLKYGVHAMELLINGILAEGGRRGRLTAKLFGGARMAANLPDIGRRNAAFAEDFLRREGIRHEGGSLLGHAARRIQFWPASGRIRQCRVAAEAAATVRTPIVTPVPETQSDVELF